MTIKKMLLRFDEVQIILNCSKDTIYQLLREKKLVAHSPNGKPERNRTKILSSSVDNYLQEGAIPAKEFKTKR